MQHQFEYFPLSIRQDLIIYDCAQFRSIEVPYTVFEMTSHVLTYNGVLHPVKGIVERRDGIEIQKGYLGAGKLPTIGKTLLNGGCELLARPDFTRVSSGHIRGVSAFIL